MRIIKDEMFDINTRYSIFNLAIIKENIINSADNSWHARMKGIVTRPRFPLQREMAKRIL